MKQVRFFITCTAFFSSVCAFALSPLSLVDFRDAMYRDPLNHTVLIDLYEKALKDIESSLTDYDLHVASARCDYYMGRSYSYAQNKEKAAFYYDSALEKVQKALDIREGAEALLMQGENMSQNCAVKPVAYALSNGLKIGKLAKRVIDSDPKNGAALYLFSAEHIYAPSPFHNYRKGIKDMKRILETPEIRLENDDVFNITSAIAYGYLQQKNYADALLWIEKALEVYPTNFFALDLKKEIELKEASL